jgi:hypothetical protein
VQFSSAIAKAGKVDWNLVTLLGFIGKVACLLPRAT